MEYGCALLAENLLDYAGGSVKMTREDQSRDANCYIRPALAHKWTLRDKWTTNSQRNRKNRGQASRALCEIWATEFVADPLFLARSMERPRVL